MESYCVALYQLRGLSGIPTAHSSLVDERGAVAYLTSSPDIHDLRVRYAAVRALGMACLLRQPLTGNSPQDKFDNLFKQQTVSEVLPVLVVRVNQSVASPKLTNAVDLGEFSFALEAFDRKELAGKTALVANRAIAALALATAPEVDCTATAIDTIFYLGDEAGKPIYSLDLQFPDSRLVVGRNLNDEQARVAPDLARGLAKKELSTLTRLLASSWNSKNDPFQEFLTAWAGLEVFVNKVFCHYEAKFLERMKASGPKGSAPFLDRIKDVMNGKYRLHDKFVLIASSLNSSGADADIELFKRIKDSRDKFAHALEGDPSKLPTQESRTLLAKYLRLHIQLASAAATTL